MSALGNRNYPSFLPEIAGWEYIGFSHTILVSSLNLHDALYRAIVSSFTSSCDLAFDVVEHAKSRLHLLNCADLSLLLDSHGVNHVRFVEVAVPYLLAAIDIL